MIRSSVEVVHSSRFNLTVSSAGERKGIEARIFIVSTKEKTTGLIILLGFILSTSCHHTSCITLFVMNFIRREASIEVLSKWSNSSRCRIISVYLTRT